MNNLSSLQNKSTYHQIAAVFGFNVEYLYSDSTSISSLNLINAVRPFYGSYARWHKTTASLQNLEGLKAFEIASKTRALLEIIPGMNILLFLVDVIASLIRCIFNFKQNDNQTNATNETAKSFIQPNQKTSTPTQQGNIVTRETADAFTTVMEDL